MSEQAGQHPIRTLVVDNHAIVRHGLGQLMSGSGEFEVCGEATTSATALRLARELEPDVAILEFAMAGEGGLALIERLSEAHPDLPILVLSGEEETLYAARALRAGARGYVMKDTPTEEVLEAIRSVARGEIVVGDRVRDRLVQRTAWRGRDLEASPLDALTDREAEVFRLLGHGRQTREVAEDLGVSVKTVESHRAKIMRKLDLDNATQLIQWAVVWTHFERREARRREEGPHEESGSN
jgi:DNA-binding NarL/FixJ family response regulator